MATPRTAERLRRGDVVELRSPEEILETLDPDGTRDDLPFMPEMLDALGQRLRVRRRVEHFTFDGAALCQGESAVREFKNNDVVLLEGLRCDGSHHGGCQRGCMFFWKEAWLRKVDPHRLQLKVDLAARERLASGFQVRVNSETFFCQSSQLFKATSHVTLGTRLIKCVRNVVDGNYGIFEMLRNLAVWAWWKLHKSIRGAYPQGKLKATPVETLGLQPGEWVEVKPLKEIVLSLDKRGCNRGLHFSPDMIPYCGRRMRVKSRADTLIIEGTGSVRKMRNTVLLEDSHVDSASFAFGACPREDHLYWREIWLSRIQPPNRV